jgi:hypothetical protein
MAISEAAKWRKCRSADYRNRIEGIFSGVRIDTKYLEFDQIKELFDEIES